MSIHATFVLFVVLLLTIASAAAAAEGSSKFRTPTIVKHLPFTTGYSDDFTLHSFLTGSQRDVYIFQHVDIVFNNDSQRTLVFQGFNVTTEQLLFKKQFLSHRALATSWKEKRMFEFNSTHAIVVYPAPSSNNKVAKVLFMSVETGNVEWSVDVVSLSQLTSLTVSSVVDQQHKKLVAISETEGDHSFILNVETRTIHPLEYVELGHNSHVTPLAFVNATNNYISKSDKGLAAVHYSTKALAWFSPMNVVATLSEPMLVGGQHAMAVVTMNASTGVFEFRLVDVITGASVTRISITSKFPFVVGYEENTRFTLHPPVDGIITLHTQVVLRGPKNDDDDDMKCTCGVIAFDVSSSAVDIVWNAGLDYQWPSRNYIDNPYDCAWHTAPDLSLGWLVRRTKHSSLEPNVTAVNMKSGQMVANAVSDNTTTSNTATNTDDTVAFAELPPANITSGLTTGAIDSAVFGNVLLLHYQVQNASEGTTLVGLRLVANQGTGKTHPFAFADNFQIDISKTSEYDKLAEYLLEPWLVQRVSKDIMIVPMYAKNEPKNTLLWVNITEFSSKSHSPDSNALVIVLGIVGCLGVVLIIAACLVGGKLRPSQKEEHNADYESLVDV